MDASLNARLEEIMKDFDPAEFDRRMASLDRASESCKRAEQGGDRKAQMLAAGVYFARLRDLSNPY